MGRYQKSHGISRTAAAALAVLAGLVLFLAGFSARAGAADIMVLDVKDAITPPVASYITENIDKAADTNKIAVILRMDTPGGLDTAMRDIIQKELNAKVPVIVYVYPKGARAASAGAIITLASDIAAMAPGTNIGAAHPVGVGGGGEEGKADTMVEKVTNDAVAYAKGIAREHGRNERWAENAVRKSISTPAQEALKEKVIDIVAQDVSDLLNQLDGRKITKNGMTFVLKTRGANLVYEPMGFRYRLLSTISNPNIAYVLMLIGMAGIYFELASPGAILPGIIGGISLILAFFAFQTLPVNYAGIALIILALILFIAEIKVPSYGMLTVGGIISMVLGSLLLFRTPELYAQVSLGIILPVTLFFTAFFVSVIYLVVKVHRTVPKVGLEGLKGETAEVYTWDPGGEGKVFCHGEYWNARGPADLKKGDHVVVDDATGMELVVRSRGSAHE